MESSNRERPSRSAGKRAAKEIESLARQVADMADQQFSRLTIPEAIAEEVARARATKGHSSRKRQMKFLAGVLRREDEACQALRDTVEQLECSNRRGTTEFHALEALRDRICAPVTSEEALEEVCATLPQVDVAVITRLARSVHESADKRARREIFRRLRDATTEAPATES